MKNFQDQSNTTSHFGGEGDEFSLFASYNLQHIKHIKLTVEEW